MQEQQTSTLPPHLERMYNEKNQLSERIDALSLFIEGNPKYSQVEDIQKSLMLIQLSAMKTYLECLDKRIIFS